MGGFYGYNGKILRVDLTPGGRALKLSMKKRRGSISAVQGWGSKSCTKRSLLESSGRTRRTVSS
jgi:hypothetical protein